MFPPAPFYNSLFSFPLIFHHSYSPPPLPDIKSLFCPCPPVSPRALSMKYETEGNSQMPNWASTVSSLGVVKMHSLFTFD